MAKYFYSEEGRTRGPVSPRQIMDLILEDRLTVDSSVMESGSPTWLRIKDIPALMRYLHESELKLDYSEDGKSLEENPKEPYFFYIPVGRLALYSLVSFGWYEIYWLYRNWHYLHLKYKKKTSVSFWRDAVNPFAIANLFYNISADRDLIGAAPREDFTSRGWLWMLSFVTMGILSSGVISLLPPLNDLLEALFSVFLLGSTLVFILPVQAFINAANIKQGKDLSFMTFGHYTLLVLGVFSLAFNLSVWVPALLGLL